MSVAKMSTDPLMVHSNFIKKNYFLAAKVVCRREKEGEFSQELMVTLGISLSLEETIMETI